ncbi:NAC domain-containing protein 92-like [Vitis riparia]|uniref:NAC domain-containing protein 92-like n=1 Tax=Vitis riparia TaxID=96939 RepID=UPI00155AEBD8|nr:NAC domain-containing protein 92-like [Vitis riparia]
MCLSPSVSPPNEISLYWSDEELFTCLQGMINGSPLPDNVIIEVNPYQHNPSCLPDRVWYLTSSEDTKFAEGFWKPKGEPYEIFSNSSITGWRTTFEFYEGTTPHVLKTDWVLQQYKITQKGQSKNIKPMASSSLCRVFQSRGQSSSHEMQKELGVANVADKNHTCSKPSVVSNTDNSTGQGSKSESQVQHGNGETGLLAAPERSLNHPVDNLPEIYFSDGDFLELGDLADPVSPSSSSDNSSCLSQTSDECFDSLALLRDLECDKDVGCKFSVAASVMPDKVVLQPASSGSLTCDDRRKLPAEGPPKTDSSLLGSTKLSEKKGLKRAIATQEADNKVEGPSSNPHNLVASSGSNKAASSDEKGKAAADRKKKLKKYLCFMPF